ncbi:hypothetical protein B0H14DRAFT_2566823 [Mycena olivaceomarginata]|nr:hypothetical protein B0H14DRAFT_2566823 [Mycena olivaceomarginata]
MSTPRTPGSTRRPPVAKPKTEPGPRQGRKPKKQDENRPPSPVPKLTEKQSQALNEYLAKRYDAEGCNTADIVYARMENDAQRAKLTEQAAHLESEQKRSEDLARQLRELQAGLGDKPDASGTDPIEHGNGGPNIDGPDSIPGRNGGATGPGASSSVEHGNGGAHGNDTADGNVDESTGTADALEKENTALKAKIARLLAKDTSGAQGEPREPIARPGGTAGMHFSIQEAMGLAGSHADYEQYKAIQRSKRNVRDLVLNARINWELPWKRIPVQQKASLFDIARKRHPYLAEFHNDWATEELVKQFIKNRRNNAYKNEWIPVPAQYGYLKANTSKRDRSAPRGRQNKLAQAGAASKAAEKKKTAAPAGKRAKISSKSKGKKKAVVDSEDDTADDDASMSNAGSEDSYDG